MTRTVLIAGPTASGKSALALAIARQANGVIINADSMQVYRELRILTARPTSADELLAPHRLYGHVAGREGYSAGRYVREAAAEIEAAHAAGRLAIVVGGTGLYFKALTEGLSPVPAIPDAIRARWRQVAAEGGASALQAELLARDPVMAARLDAGDVQRMTRALEVIETTGRSLASWQATPGTPVVAPGTALLLKLERPRDDLNARASRRFHEMIAEGALDEVRALAGERLATDLPIMRALGVRPLLAHLAGETTLETAIDAAIGETRHYIKRQQTWLRAQMSAYTAIALGNEVGIGACVDHIQAWLRA